MDCFYIGTKRKLFEVRAPSVNMPSGKGGFANELTLLNGGTTVRRSVAAHKRYTLTWNFVDRDDARVILDLADGVYGTGPIYWHDPFAADRNVLPQWWATPSQGGVDGLPLNGGQRGTLSPTPLNDLNMPVDSIEYTVQPNSSRKVWVPIPRGHTAHIGVYGQDGTGGNVQLIPTFAGEESGAPITLDLLDVTDNSMFNQTLAANPNRDGFDLTLGGTGTVTLTAMMVQVLKNGESPDAQSFISGQGHSGLSFLNQPNYTPYSSVYTKAGLAAEFVETGGWSV